MNRKTILTITVALLLTVLAGCCLADDCTVHVGEVVEMATDLDQKPAKGGKNSTKIDIKVFVKKASDELYKCRMEITGRDGGEAKAWFLDKDNTPLYTVQVTVMDHETEVRNAKAATCTEAGYTGDVYCITCGKTIPGREIPAIGHKEVIDAQGTPATCTENGKDKVSHCETCGAKIGTGAVIPATGHDWQEQAGGVQPTCTEAGYADYVCGKCGKTRHDDLAAKGHKAVILPAQAPTETTTGLTEGSYCSACGEILKAQETVPPDDPTAKFVDRCYRLILNRGSDAEGLVGWTEALKNQTRAASEIVSSFLHSAEFTARGLKSPERVDILYQTMLGRGADPAGSSAWTELLDNGCTDDLVINGFSGSVEFTGICSDYGVQPGAVTLTEYRDQNPQVTAFVNRCYTEALDRGGDPEGLNAWCGAILNREATPQQVAKGFTASPEMQNKGQTDEEFVKTMYSLYLGRECDPAGLAAWTQALAEGAGREQVEQGFADSVEFAGIVAGYGLE